MLTSSLFKNNKKPKLNIDFTIPKFDKISFDMGMNKSLKINPTTNMFSVKIPKIDTNIKGLFNSKNFNYTPNTKSSIGASTHNQNMWKGFSSQKRDLMRIKYKDSDGDRIPDKYDCQPLNVMRQDSWKFPKGVIPYNEEEEKPVELQTYGKKETPQPVQIIDYDQNKVISLGEYSDNIRQQGQLKFISTTKLNKPSKLQDLYERAAIVYPLNYNGFQQWSKNIQGTDLEGVDTPDNTELINEYESQQEAQMNIIPQEYINRAYQHMRDNPEIYSKVNKQEAVRELAIVFMEGGDPTYIDQDYADMGNDTTYDSYKENEQNESMYDKDYD